jgi:rubredoxin
MTKYKCTVCGWVYDPAIGDPDGSINSGVSFDQLPAGYTCPVCGASKDMFEKISD